MNRLKDSAPLERHGLGLRWTVVAGTLSIRDSAMPCTVFDAGSALSAGREWSGHQASRVRRNFSNFHFHPTSMHWNSDV